MTSTECAGTQSAIKISVTVHSQRPDVLLSRERQLVAPDFVSAKRDLVISRVHRIRDARIQPEMSHYSIFN